MQIVRVASESFLSDISRLEQECFSTPWSYSEILSSYKSGCVFLVSIVDDKVVGYAGFYISGDITNICVSNEYRGRGIGKALVESLVNTAKSMSLTDLFLEVRVSNNIAIALYEKCGFKYVTTRKKYYKNGEDALIYSREV